MKLMLLRGLAVLVLVLAVLTAGCTTNNTNQTPSATSSATSSAAPSAATQHDAFLEKYLTAYKNASYSNSSLSVKAWELTWINSTSARLEWTALNKPVNMTANHVETFIVFPTSQDATNYLNAMNKTAYSLASTQYPSGGAYQKATGHAPQIYKDYVYNEGNPLNISEYKRHEIGQLDNIVVVSTGKVLG